MNKGAIFTLILIFGLFFALFWVIPAEPSSLSLGLGTGVAFFLAIYYIFAAASERKRIKGPVIWIPVFSLSLLGLLLPAAFAAIMYVSGMFSVIGWLLMIALTFTFFFAFFSVPLAFFSKCQEQKGSDFTLKHYPLVTVLVPAYNEEKVLGPTIECILEAAYPKKEVIIIDDGSTDRTYQIALGFADRGVKVVHRPNGGKSAALNYGLFFARGEIVIIVDADSMIGKNALVEMVRPFQDKDVVATAGNIKVLNRKNLLTKCQAVEYIASINIFRRALDIFGKITVVPGALGAYRRDILTGGGSYDPDTLVEDFDVTVKALKTGKVIHASSSALCYTEAPEHLRDFVKQRLRWYRGNFQTMWKHKDAGFNTRFGFLQRLSYPYMLFSMLFMPPAGLVVVASVILVFLGGVSWWLLYMFLFFLALQVLLTVFALQLDDEDMRLVLYAPFFLAGYKHLCDFIMLRSLFDVLFRRKQLEWGRARRIGAQPNDQGRAFT
ncbi:glycosyltransferase family 2 protein [Chloroflexota bacterium]